MTAFALQMEEFIVSTEIGCPTNPKIVYYVAPYRKSLSTSDLELLFVYVSHVSLCVGVELCFSHPFFTFISSSDKT